MLFTSSMPTVTLHSQPAPAIPHGPIDVHGSLTWRDGRTAYARYASGAIAEWFDTFEATLIEHIYLKDSFGRRNRGGEIHQCSSPRVFVTRYRRTDADGTVTTKYHVLNASGTVSDLKEDEAARMLVAKRVNGQLVYVSGDAVYEAAAERHRALMAY